MTSWDESDLKKEHKGCANNLQTFTNQFIKFANSIFKPMETNFNLNLVVIFTAFLLEATKFTNRYQHAHCFLPTEIIFRKITTFLFAIILSNQQNSIQKYYN